MKKYIPIIFAVFILGCSEERSKEMNRKFHITLNNGEGFWTYSSNVIHCDSFNMEGLTKADVWIDGVKMHVESKSPILPGNGY